jgi:hypothetical protein
MPLSWTVAAVVLGLACGGLARWIELRKRWPLPAVTIGLLCSATFLVVHTMTGSVAALAIILAGYAVARLGRAFARS